MKTSKLKYTFFLLTILVFNSAFSQSDLIKELNKNIIEIKTISPDSNFNDINELLPILKNKKIVALGEATHGTYEFFVYKHRLIKLLTTQADFKIIIIEGDFAGSLIMNDYVLYGKGTIKDALFGIGYGIWMTQEFANLIEWIKKYNSNKEIKKFLETNYPRGRAIEVFRSFHFDLKVQKTKFLYYTSPKTFFSKVLIKYA